MIEESYFDDLDRDFLNVSSFLASFYRTFGRLGSRLVAPLDPATFDNATSKTKELGIRALILLTAVFSLLECTYIALTAVVLGAASKFFRAAGFYFQKNGFTHIKGSAPEKRLENGEATVMTWDIQGQRIDRVVQSIERENPDILVLQEVYDTDLIEALIAKLKDRYPHFYTHLGPNTWGDESGCMVITKCAVHRFTHTDFTEKDPATNRGFGLLEIKASPDDSLPSLRIIGTQLTPEEGAERKRIEQIEQIVGSLAKQKEDLPTLLVGNLSIDRDSDQEEAAFLSKYLYHSYLDREPTHSNQSVDFISFFKRNPGKGEPLPVLEKGVRLIECHLVGGFDETYSTKTAQSDYHALVTKFSGLKPPAGCLN